MLKYLTSTATHRKLMDEKSGKMMPPAAVIASVGTQVWCLTEDKRLGSIKAY